MASVQAAHGRLQRDIGQLHGPLSAHMLEHLPACSLAALRSSCKVLRSLIDDAPLMAVKPGLAAILPPVMIDQASNSQALQALLRRHGHAMANLQAGRFQQAQHVVFSEAEQDVWGFDLAPGWPSARLACLTAQAGLGAMHLQLLDFKTLQPLEGVPHIAWAVPTIFWQAWISSDCLLVMQRPPEAGYMLAVLDTSLGQIHASVADVSSAAKDCLSPQAISILVWKPYDAGLDLHALPSLEHLYRVHPPPNSATMLEPDISLTANLAQWSATGEHFAVIWGQLDGTTASYPRRERPHSFLTTHDAADGSCLGILNLELHLGWSWAEEDIQGTLCFKWSPSAPQILVSEVEDRAQTRSPAAVVQVDGSFGFSQSLSSFCTASMDGQSVAVSYTHGSTSKIRSRCLTLRASYGMRPLSGRSSRGTVRVKAAGESSSNGLPHQDAPASS